VAGPHLHPVLSETFVVEEGMMGFWSDRRDLVFGSPRPKAGALQRDGERGLLGRLEADIFAVVPEEVKERIRKRIPIGRTGDSL